MLGVQPGDRVRIHYATCSNQGNVIETSEHREPFEFTVGDRDVIEGINRSVIGMTIGEKKRITVPPEQAFGARDPRLQQLAPRIALPDRLDEGDQLSAVVAGCALDCWIRGLRDDEVMLDANHPLAGETLILDLELMGFGTPLQKASQFE